MSNNEEKLYSDEKLDVTNLKCPNCGGEMQFDPKLQKLKCLYCGGTVEVEEKGRVEERDLEELLQKGAVWTEAEVYQCKSCGAKEILNKQEVAMHCPFCGTSNIIKTDELPGLKPQGVTPFKIEKEKANDIVNNYVKRKKFAPNDLKKGIKTEDVIGIYNPVFTFDAKTTSSYSGLLGENYTVTTKINGKYVTVTKTKYFPISGNIDNNFDDIIVQASSNIPKNIIERLEPFPTNDALTYNEEYLRGYSASTYNKEGSSCWKEAQIKISSMIERGILNKYSYDVKVRLSVNTTYLSKQYKYILVPVYVGHYKYREKVYNFFINGCNGNAYGKTPVSKVKVGFTVAAIALFIILIALLIIFCGGGE